MSLINSAPYGQQQETFLASAPSTTFVSHDAGISLGSSSYGSHELSVSAPVVQQTFQAAPATFAIERPLTIERPVAIERPLTIERPLEVAAPTISIERPLATSFVASAPLAQSSY